MKASPPSLAFTDQPDTNSLSGVPVVMAGDNHVAYDFALTPQTVEDYARLINTAGELRCDADLDQLREFYYMHYCHYQSAAARSVYPPSDFVNA